VEVGCGRGWGWGWRLWSLRQAAICWSWNRSQIPLEISLGTFWCLWRVKVSSWFWLVPRHLIREVSNDGSALWWLYTIMLMLACVWAGERCLTHLVGWLVSARRSAFWLGSFQLRMDWRMLLMEIRPWSVMIPSASSFDGLCARMCISRRVHSLADWISF